MINFFVGTAANNRQRAAGGAGSDNSQHTFTMWTITMCRKVIHHGRILVRWKNLLFKLHLWRVRETTLSISESPSASQLTDAKGDASNEINNIHDL